MSKELVEKKNDKIERAEYLVNSAKAENRALTAEETAEIEGINEEVRSINKTLELEDQVEQLGKDKNERGDDNSMNEELKTREAQERKAFENYIRGIETRNGELAPAASSAGALIPTTILDYVIRKVYDLCPVLDKSQKFNVKGKLAIPYYPADSANITVAYANEFTDLASTSGKFDTVELGGFLAGALTKVSRSLINNANIDIVEFVVDEMAKQIARFVEHEILNGTSGKVTGLSTLSNSVTAASASAITMGELVKLQAAVKDQYQANACWIMNAKTRTAIYEALAGDDRLLFNFDPANGFRATILGKPVFVSDNMPEIATGATVIYYGDFNGLATKFSEEASVEVLREVYAAQHAVGVVGWVEFDAKVIDEQQIAKLVMA